MKNTRQTFLRLNCQKILDKYAKKRNNQVCSVGKSFCFYLPSRHKRCSFTPQTNNPQRRTIMSSDLILAYLIMNLLPGLVFLYFGNKVSRTGKFFHRWFGIGLCLCGIIFAGGPLTARMTNMASLEL